MRRGAPPRCAIAKWLTACVPAQILRHKDTDGSPLLEKIRDAAGQKGTGKWTAIESLEQGMPVTLIGEAVFARCLSALQDQRIAASTRLAGPNGAKFTGDRAAFLDSIRQALFASKVVSYAQGFMLMAEAAKQYGWKLNYGEISLMWRGGCIIRSVFLAKIKEAYDTDPELPNLLLAPYFTEALAKCQDGWRQVRCRRRCPASESRRAEHDAALSFHVAGGRPVSDARCSDPGALDRARFLRRVPLRAWARQPPAGARREIRETSRSLGASSDWPRRRRSAITSARTRSSASRSAASGSTPTGPAPPAASPRRPTTHELAQVDARTPVSSVR